MRPLATILAISGWLTLGLILTLALWLISRWMGKVGTMAAARETQRGGGCGGGQRPEQVTSLTHDAKLPSR